MPTKSASLNIHEKLLKIADMAGVLRKNKKGYNYNYTTEDEIQAKITAGMQKYGVMLEPGIVPGTLSIQPITYQKYDKRADKDITIHEIIVSCEVEYEWVNVDSPDQTIKKTWSYIGQMEDASQAFGAGATYGNRYYLLKALQLATIEDDPDNYRSKQKEAEQYEELQIEKEKKEKLKKVIAEITDKGKELVVKGLTREKLLEIVGTFNDGNGNPNAIKDIEIANKVLEELKATELEKPKKENEEKERLKAAIAEITALGSELMTEKYGKSKAEIQAIVAELNDGSYNADNIKNVEIAEQIKSKLLKLKKS